MRSAHRARNILAISDHGIRNDIISATHDWRESVRELHDADGGDEARDILHLRDSRADDECERPIYKDQSYVYLE